MKSIRRLTGKEKERVREEARKSVHKWFLEHCDELDSVILYTLNVCEGFGEKRLKRFYKNFNDLYDELRERYELDHTTDVYRMKLKEKGIDISKWREEYEEEEL